MNNLWHDMDSSRIDPHDFLAVIEIPKGSKSKYELDKKSGYIILDRILYTSTHYPANYGFIPKTYGDDDDPLDVLVLCNEPIYPMTLVHCYPIGVINMVDNFSRDEKIIAIPHGDPTFNNYKSIKELPSHIFDEMEHFFTVYKQLEGKNTAVSEIQGQKAAVEVIRKAIDNYKAKFG
jgi:inorganic pyrophosphatase